MKLLYSEEHISCVNYLTNKTIGFSIKSLNKEDDFFLFDKKLHYILFLKRGKLRLTFKNVSTKVLYGEEMIYIPTDNEGEGFAESDSEFILLGFDNSYLNLCDEFSIKELIEQCKIERAQSVSVPIYPPMKMVLESVRFYLDNKISCLHLHEMKQKEVFLILRTFYSKKENAEFFAPLLLPS